MPRAYHFEQSRSVAASADLLWPLVADTDRLNRATGLPQVHYQASPRVDGGSTTIGEYRLGPVPFLRWTEEPFEWEAPRFYHVERHYHWGPIASFKGGMEITQDPQGSSTVRVWADLVPRGPLASLLVRSVGKYGVARGVRQVEVFERYLAGEIDSAFPGLLRGDPEEDPVESVSAHMLLAPWARLAEAEGSASPVLVERLRRHLEHSPDSDVLNMRPLVLADAWQADRLDVLSLFLYAAQAGLVILHWDVLCPHCRVAKASYRSLSDLQPGAFCSSCTTAFQADFDRNVEVRFDVAPTLRRAQAVLYCEAGPMNTPHRIARRTVAARGVAALDGDLRAGRYRLVSRQSKGSVALDAGPQPVRSLSTRVVSVYPSRMGPDTLGLEPGQVTLSLVNHLETDATVDLERADWPDTLATAALVSTLGTFRDLFSTDVLAAGQQVAIGRLTFLIAGIAEPAAVYASLGQARAFTIVEAYLRAGLSIIAAHHGAITGTLGETMLATFSAPGPAIEAALALQRSAASMTHGTALDSSRLVQIGIHEGACVGAMVADRLTYFGLAPSTTASLLGATRGGEILMSAQVAADVSVAAQLLQAELPVTIEEISVGGGVLEVCRVQTWQAQRTLAVRKSA